MIEVRSFRHSDQFHVRVVPPRFVVTEAETQLSRRFGLRVAEIDTFWTAKTVLAIPCINANAAECSVSTP